MPFSELIPHPFTSGAVRVYAPAAEGVYGISNSREWIYIGEADDIQGALLHHLNDARAAVMKMHPTGFVCEICEQRTRTARQGRLITEYGPACNRSASRY